MNNSPSAAWRFLAAALALPLAALLLASCDVGSSDTSAVPSDEKGAIYNYSGLYMNKSNAGDVIVFPINKQSGKKLTWLRLLQTGTELEAYDNAGKTWDGSISTIQSGTANFSLSGSTTDGQAVNIAGTLVYKDQQSEMNATWIEPTFYGNIIATATVSPATTNTPTSSVTMNPSSTVSLSSSKTQQIFTVSGGSGSYAWELSTATYGSLNTFLGSTVTYTANGTTGTTTITVYDSLNSQNSDNNTIKYQ